MAVRLLDGTLFVSVRYCVEEGEYEDNICVSFREECPDEEKIFCANETNISLTPKEAIHLAKLLLAAADESLADRETEISDL